MTATVRGLDERWVDGAIAAAVGLAMAVEVVTSSHLKGSPALNLLGVAAAAAPLALRRRRPIVAAGASLAAALATSALLTPLTELVTPLALGLLLPYSVAAHLPRKPALAGLVLCAAGSTAIYAASPGDPGAILPVTGLTIAAWAAGWAVRDRGHRAVELHETALALEEQRRRAELLAVAAERARIARDLHDVVAHGMTAVALQAAAARRVWETDPERGRQALAAVGTVARETLGHVRLSLQALGHGLADLDALVEHARRTGLRVAVSVEGRPRPLPEPVDQVAYRVLQESLTNAARHAAPASVALHVVYGERELGLKVVNGGRDGPAAPPVAGSGHGLRGMSERVAGCGGELRHGRRPGGGFEVMARLPL